MSQDLKGFRIAVTGAGGFIGSHLTEALLKRGAKVKAFVRYNSRSFAGFLSDLSEKKKRDLEIIFGDVRDPYAVNKLLMGVDWVFHLAALIGIPYSYEAPESYIATNISGTLHVLEASRTNSIKRVIITSTSEVYGTAIQVPMKETHPLQGQSPYSATKIGADMMSEAYARSFGLPVVIVRPFNTFGPRQSMRAVIPTLICQAISESKIHLGNTSTIRDFNFVGNTVDGFISCALTGVADGRVYNLASGSGRTIQETAETILSIVGSRAKIIQEESRLRPERSEVQKLIGDATRALNELAWKPSISFEEGLKLTLEWVKSNPEFYPNPRIYRK